ncbi:MAG: IclR family transcriptional regulator, partial [Chloroflexota bacterium]
YSTLYRYLATLESGGYLERDPRSGLYRLGLRLVEHAGIVLNQIDARLHALPELEALADDVGSNGNLAVLFDGDTFHIGYAIRSYVPPIYTTLGRRAVAHCTALGKCLLAGLPREDVHALISAKGWRPYTANSIQSVEALDRELDTVSAQGYAIDREERHRNLWCVGAPIRDRTGRVVAAMSVSGPSRRFQGQSLDAVIESVVSHAERASCRLGHEPLLAGEP